MAGRQEERMQGISQQAILVLMTILVLVAIPTGLILKRLGFGMWWALLCLVPAAAFVGLWTLAFIRWPRDGQTQP
jgi:hypothetical protein